MLASVSVKADMQNVCIDSTVARAHACAAGATGSNAAAEALGRYRGGFGCKIHALTDALGLPVRFILTGGQAADITQATPLMQDISTGALLADKGYDANALLDWLGQRDIAAMIPPKATRKVQRGCDWYMYKERHVIECMFGKLKYFVSNRPTHLDPVAVTWSAVSSCGAAAHQCGCSSVSASVPTHPSGTHTGHGH